MTNVNYGTICSHGMRILDLFPGLRTHFLGDNTIRHALRDLQSRSGRNSALLAYSLQDASVQDLEQLLEDLTAIVQLHGQRMNENVERSEMFDAIAAVRGNEHSKRASQKKHRQAISLLPTWTLSAGIEELKQLIKERKLQDALQKADFEGMRARLNAQVDEAEQRFTRDYWAFLNGRVDREPRAMSVVATIGNNPEGLASSLGFMGLTPEESQAIDRSLRAMEGINELDSVQSGDLDILAELESVLSEISMPEENFSEVPMDRFLKKELRNLGLRPGAFQVIAICGDPSPFEASSRWQG